MQSVSPPELTLSNDCFLFQSRSRAIHHLLDSARRAAASDATILLCGESGTGKSRLAKQIHLWSARREKPFLSVEAAALAGYDPTRENAVRSVGRAPLSSKYGLESADGGTLFLANVEDLSPSAQLECVRLLQQRTIETSQGFMPIDVRVIGATTQDLVREVKLHRVREDLFYSLNIISLYIPPLRARSADIPSLAVAMLSEAAIRHRRSELRLSQEAADAIARYPWPGNLRELRNTMESASILCRGDAVSLDNLPAAIAAHLTARQSVASSKESIDVLEREHIQRVLSESSTLDQAAATLGINVTTLWRKRRQYRLGGVGPPSSTDKS